MFWESLAAGFFVGLFAYLATRLGEAYYRASQEPPSHQWQPIWSVTFK